MTAEKAVLNYPSGYGWAPSDTDLDPWLEVKLILNNSSCFAHLLITFVFVKMMLVFH